MPGSPCQLSLMGLGIAEKPAQRLYDVWLKLVDIQAFKQKQVLSSVSMSDIIVEILGDTVNHSPYYQGILSGKFTPEQERAPAMKKRIEQEGGVSWQGK